MCNYLQRGPNGVYYFRMSIPEHLRPIIGKREFKFSLRTTDHPAAKRRILQIETPRHTALLEAAKAELARSQGAPLPSPAPAPFIPDPLGPQTQEEFEQWEQNQREQLGEAIAEEDAWEQAEAYVAALPKDHPAAMIVHWERERGNGYRSRYHRRKRKDKDREAPAHAPMIQQGPIPAGNAVSMLALLEGHAKTGQITPSIAKEWTASIERFIAFIGHDDARKVTQADIRKWKNHVRDEPQKNGKPRSAQRINAGYLAPIRAAFKYGMNEMLLEHNPAAAVPKLRLVQKVEVRDRMFTPDERNTILAATFKVEQDDTVSPYRKLARRWIPWLCAYSGARVNELTQLRRQDLQQIEGHWVIRIRSRLPPLRSKGTGLVRPGQAHPDGQPPLARAHSLSRCARSDAGSRGRERQPSNRASLRNPARPPAAGRQDRSR